MKLPFSFLLGVVVCLDVAAQEVRFGKFEIGGAFQWFAGQTVNGDVGGTGGRLKVDDIFSGGLHFGYNFTEQLNVNTEFVFGEADLSYSSAGGSRSDDASFFAWMVNLDYYILPTRFTPFVSAGIGLLGLTNEYEDDYWYYYYWDDRELPIDEVNFIWNVGGGVRWDPIDNLYLRLGYRLNGTQLEYADEYMYVHSVILAVGYSFDSRW